MVSISSWAGISRRTVQCVAGATLLMVASQALAFTTNAKQAIVVDYDTSTVLYSKNPDELMHPSSMSKLMTVYLVFERLKEGKIKLNDTFPVSEKAWRMQGSKMFVHVGDSVKVQDLLHGVVTQSGNDACIVLAEGLAGSESAFAELMTQKARELGMQHSTFKNSTGWPDPDHLMTARDLATLATRIIHDFPEYYAYFAEPSYTYSGIHQPNRNLLLARNIGVDGLKTGHTEDGGYGITVSGQRNGRRLVVVVNGLSSEKERADEAQELFSYAMLNYENKQLFKAGQTVDEAQVWYGAEDQVPLVVAKDVKAIVPTIHQHDVKVEVSYQSPIQTPVEEGQKLGELVVSVPDMEPQKIPLVAGKTVDKASYFGRLVKTAKYRMQGL